MAVTYSKTREDLRKAIGRNLGKMVTGVTSGGGSTTTALDSKLFGGDDEYIGKYIRFTSGTNDGTTARVSDYTASSGTMTFAALDNTVSVGVGYELWSDGNNPDNIDEYINQAIMKINGRIYDPVEDISLKGDKINARFEMPSTLSMLQDVYYRTKITEKLLHSCNNVFDERTDSDITQAIDTEEYKKVGSLKLTMAAGLSAGDFISDSITSVDLSKYDYLEFWIKSTVATSAGNLKIHLDNGAVTADGNDKESLNVPALTADIWKHCRVSLSNPESDTAIISIGLEHDSDLGVCTVYLDDIRAVKSDTAVYTKLPRHLWRIDKEGTTLGASTADLVLTDSGRASVGNSLLKLVGGDSPALLSSDSGTTEVPESYIISYATAVALQAGSIGVTQDPDASRQAAIFWLSQAAEDRNSLPLLTNIRLVR
tara:strand:- start:682 stop:1962 length:1281 start_codon:yes stop_codon:yes gene_type:complete